MKTVLITGVGRGIGLKLVEEFLKRGYAVIGTVRDDAGKQRAEQTAAALGKAVETHIVELTEQTSVEGLKRALADRAIDILINNAGIRGENDQTYISLDLDEWLNILQVNTIAPMRVTLALLPNLLQAEQAKIVTISSAMGSMARERNDAIAYRSSKTAVNKAMQCLAVDLRPKQVGVYLMHPGWVRTDMGGPEGEVSAEQSASGLADTIVNFDLDDSGTFWNYDGEALEW